MCFRPEHEKPERTPEEKPVRAVDHRVRTDRRRPPMTAPRGNGEIERSDVDRSVEKLDTLVGR